MPSVSPDQKKLMAAVAHGWKKPGGGGPSVAVAKEFNQADAAANSDDDVNSSFMGGTVSKSSGLHNASYAQGGAVLGRTRDFLKEPDRFRNDGGKDRDPTPEPTEDVWGKGSSKANPKGRDKSEKPIKPRQ